jgi:hypothetical protein
VSYCIPDRLEEVVHSYAQDPRTADLVTKLTLNPDFVPNYTLTSGVLSFKGKIWLGHDDTIQSKVIAALHTSALGGHSGFPVTYSKLC